MIDLLKQQFAPKMTNEEKINRVREALQLAALKIMYEKGHFAKLAFVGGTALRLLFGLKRFSEDLDFSLIRRKGYDFREINSHLQEGFRLYGLDVQTKAREENTVQYTFLKFTGLLKDLGLSALDEQKLSIKVEIDSNPPKGWRIETTLINRLFMINLQHFDLSSLYASKIHACFFRKYTKGRDFYDLLWYITKRIRPNYILLRNAIKQTESYQIDLNDDNFHLFMLEKLKKINFGAVRKDVERFLEDKSELNLLNLKTIGNNLARKSPPSKPASE